MCVCACGCVCYNSWCHTFKRMTWTVCERNRDATLEAQQDQVVIVPPSFFFEVKFELVFTPSVWCLSKRKDTGACTRIKYKIQALASNQAQDQKLRGRGVGQCF